MKAILSDAEAREILSGVGVESDLTEDVVSAMEECVLTKISICDKKTCSSAKVAKLCKQMTKKYSASSTRQGLILSTSTT